MGTTTNFENKISELQEKADSLNHRVDRLVYFAFIIAIAGIILFLIIYKISYADSTPLKAADWGSLLSGTLGPFFSLSGILIVYIAFTGQKQQIFLQQISLLQSQFQMQQNSEDINKNITLLQSQKDEMQEQNNSIQIQLFNSVFFELVSNVIKIKENFHLSNDRITCDGEIAITEVYYDFLSTCEIAKLIDIPEKPAITSICSTHIGITNIFNFYVHIIHQVDKNFFLVERDLYYSALYYNMSEHERTLFFYYCVFIYDDAKRMSLKKFINGRNFNVTNSNHYSFFN